MLYLCSMTLKEIAIEAVNDAGSKEEALKAISYGKAKLTTDNMFNYITDAVCKHNMDILEKIQAEINNL